MDLASDGAGRSHTGARQRSTVCSVRPAEVIDEAGGGCAQPRSGLLLLGCVEATVAAEGGDLRRIRIAQRKAEAIEVVGLPCPLHLLPLHGHGHHHAKQVVGHLGVIAVGIHQFDRRQHPEIEARHCGGIVAGVLAFGDVEIEWVVTKRGGVAEGVGVALGQIEVLMGIGGEPGDTRTQPVVIRLIAQPL